MMYIQLEENYRNYDKVRIIEVNFFEISNRISFRYQIFKRDGSEYKELFDKMISITEQDELNSFLNFTPVTGTTIKDGISRKILQYLLDNNIEKGILEIEL